MRRNWTIGLAWVFALGALLLAWVGKHPYLLALRGIEMSMVAACGIGGLLMARREAACGRLGLTAARLLGATCGVAILLALGQEIRFRQQREEVLAADAIARRLGRHFMVGYTDAAEVAVLAQRGLIGGIYIGRGNVRGRGVAALRAEIAALQALRRDAGLPPLWVAADQEGGSVAHMTPPLAPQPSLATLIAAGIDSSLESRARAYGVAQGRGLSAIGVTLNFGPVVDLLPGATRPRFDTHTLLHRRAIAGDPLLVTRVAGAYAEGLASQGVRPTLKHFPGLGRVVVDTHHSLGRIEAPRAELLASDWRPFRALAGGETALMVGHVVLDEIDPMQPASLSAAVIQGLLRRDWGFRGLVVTDDLNMGAVYRMGIDKAATAALAAGADLLLVSYDPDQYFRAMHGAMAAYRAGEIDAAMLDESAKRLDASL